MEEKVEEKIDIVSLTGPTRGCTPFECAVVQKTNVKIFLFI